MPPSRVTNLPLRLRQPLALALAALMAGACAGDSMASRATLRDSAGIAIAENEWTDSAGAAWWRLTAEPVLDVGTLEGPEAQTLFRVVDAVRLSDGRVAVANAGTSEVRYYDASGTHVVSSGRQGGGPGEFQRINRLIRLGGDSLAVIDGQARRVSLLDWTGRFVADRAAGNPDAPVSVVGRVPDGSWIGTMNIFAGGVAGLTNGLSRRDVTYVLLTPDAEQVADTVGTFAGSETWMQVEQRAGRIGSISIMNNLPFRRTTAVVPHGDQLFVATQDAPEVRVFGLDGTLARIVRTGAPQTPVTPEMVEAWADRRVATMPPERRADAREASLRLPAGETVPPYGVVAVDRTGRLWVQDYAGLVDDPAWTVYDAQGARLARIVLPGAFRPFDIGEDWILGRETDELEVEHVRLYGFGPVS